LLCVVLAGVARLIDKLRREESPDDAGAAPDAVRSRRRQLPHPHREFPRLDEKLYLEVFAQPEAPAPRRTAARR